MSEGGRVREDSTLGPSDLGMVLFIRGFESELRWFLTLFISQEDEKNSEKCSEFVYSAFYLKVQFKYIPHDLIILPYFDKNQERE